MPPAEELTTSVIVPPASSCAEGLATRQSRIANAVTVRALKSNMRPPKDDNAALAKFSPKLVHRSQSHPGEARQHLGTEIRHVVEIVHERYRKTAEAGAAQIGELFRHLVRCPDERIAANTVRCHHRTLAREYVRSGVLRRDVLEREHPVDGAPVRVLDIGIVIVVLGLLLRRPADHLSLRVDLDLAPELASFGLDIVDLL